MRSNTNAIKHTHIRVPSIQDASHWVQKLFTREKTADVALFATVVLLSGWVIYCLSSAVAHSHFVP
jgi:hypothetical protein